MSEQVALPENYRWLLEQEKEYPGSVLDYKPEWDAFRFLIADKMFAMFGSDNQQRTVLTVKGTPEDNERYCTMYGCVLPGYYMNKAHWISILLDELDVPQDFIFERLACSYQLVLGSLSKKMQKQILENM